MAKRNYPKQAHVRHDAWPLLIAMFVAANGVFIVATTLVEQFSVRHGSHLGDITVDLPLLIGLSLIYLSTLLRRRKRSIWLLTMLAYMFYLGLAVASALSSYEDHHLQAIKLVRSIAVPLLVILLLAIHEKQYVVKSDIRSFRWALRLSLIVLVVAFIYGVTGFLLFDERDFHQEIGWPSAVHYTLDQFDLTTNRPLRPATKRAHLFVDSLSFISVSSVALVVFSLAQPLRLRFSDQSHEREKMRELLEKYHGQSEDFFKLWPHDKQYYFNQTGTAGLAYHTSVGVAVCVGDPVGRPAALPALINEFRERCYENDWLLMFVHASGEQLNLYTDHGLAIQKIGQEAVVNLGHFVSETSKSKYFRHIDNKFSKQGFTAELLTPPHHTAVLGRLHSISNEWLSHGNRAERGFAMGYYSETYMQQCPVMVVRDAAGTIQAFINQLPTDYDHEEANFDLLRHTSQSLGNINDYLLLQFIKHLHEHGYKRLNLGLCPLTGLDESTDVETHRLIDGALRFAYANGNRFYSFDGLYRFKKKYEPVWRDRYIAYQGGLRGFSRGMTALMRNMRVRHQRS